jgi:hypothetical protein
MEGEGEGEGEGEDGRVEECCDVVQLTSLPVMVLILLYSHNRLASRARRSAEQATDGE